jgi:predicted aldo/keto reductase-like oxidoreductase
MRQAMDEGLVKRTGFSFHDKPENMRRLIDTGMMELVTCQYNYLDRSNEDAIRYAHEKGLGVVVMGPVGGGRLSIMPKRLRQLDGLAASNAAELALRFVLAHPGVNVALSGMGSIEMVEQNCAAVDVGALSADEVSTLNEMLDGMKDLAQLYCTGCGYCMPCPDGVNISRVFELVNYHRVYGLEAYAMAQYQGLVEREQDAAQCVECGTCLERCPQNIAIIDQLKEAVALFVE